MTPAPKPNALATVPIFAGLDDATLQEMTATSRIRLYPGGQVLCSEGDPGEDLLLLEAGQVRVSRFASAGQEIVLAEVEAPAVFGELALIDGAPRAATLTAMTEVTVRYLGRRIVMELIEREPSVALAMMRAMAAMVRATNERLADVLALDVPGRLAKWLLAHAGDDGRVMLGTSQEALARSLGTTRESVNRSLRRFERVGLIDVRDRIVTIRDEAALRSIAEG